MCRGLSSNYWQSPEEESCVIQKLACFGYLKCSNKEVTQPDFWILNKNHMAPLFLFCLFRLNSSPWTGFAIRARLTVISPSIHQVTLTIWLQSSVLFCFATCTTKFNFHLVEADDSNFMGVGESTPGFGSDFTDAIQGAEPDPQNRFCTLNRFLKVWTETWSRSTPKEDMHFAQTQQTILPILDIPLFKETEKEIRLCHPPP